MVLEGLKPQRVFEIFEEITRIPHGSGNVERISNYLVEFAKKNKLWYRQDESFNVIIKKPSNGSMENAVILQGHMDMVAVKTEDKDIDLNEQGLDIFIEGDYIGADRTSLGGDDGIAVAYALAILESNEEDFPPIEAVFTVDEEVGMLGAEAIDLSDLDGKMMLNIDSEEEGIFLSSCAGGATLKCEYNFDMDRVHGKEVIISVKGLTSGHSGTDIICQRANANVVLGRILFDLSQEYNYNIKELSGGEKDNSIAPSSKAVIVIDDNYDEIIEKINNYAKILKSEYQVTDPQMCINAIFGDEGEHLAYNYFITDRIVLIYTLIPDGVVKMSNDIKGLVQTSLNLGVVVMEGSVLKMTYLLRSSVESEKEYLINKLISITELMGGQYEISGRYPAWEYNKNSKLRDIMSERYEELFGHKPEIQAIHAGVECGIMAYKILDLDCISFGPDIKDIHTVNERLSISSVERTWKLLIDVLKKLAN